MDFDTLDRQLRLMVLLTQNKELTTDEICGQLGFTRRTFYRYIDAFRQMGFVVIKDAKCYRLDKTSPFFRKVTELIHFTEDEAVTLHNVLDSVRDNSVEVRHLRDKLARLFDWQILEHHQVDETLANNLHQLYEAVKQQRVVVIRDYRSSRSGTVTDRIVEPYQFLAGNEDVRCYELATAMNKTFRLARMGQVAMLDVKWSHQAAHTPFHTDLFHFSGEEQWPVKLRLSRMAAELLREEYPASDACLTQEDEAHWLFATTVCSYKGIGRFVLGLFEEIEIIDSPDFLHFLQEKASHLTQKISV